jgi:thiol-disulfide isomerase/thioredoxin
MRRILLPLLLLVAACSKGGPRGESTQAQDAAAGESAAVAAGKVDRRHAGQPAPQTEFLDPDGQSVTLAEFEGKPVLVNLWATWCAPCVQEMPTLDRLAAQQGDKLQVVALSQDMGGPEKVEAFFSKRPFSRLEAWRDPKMQIMSDLKIEILPTTLLFDAEGREVWRVTGQEDWTGQQAAALLREAFRRR